MVFVPAAAGHAPTLNFAVPIRRDVDHAAVSFEATTSKTYYYYSALPGTYAGGGLTFKLTFAMDTASSGNVQWDLAFERLNTDLDSTSFTSATSATQAVSVTPGIPVVATVTVTDGANMDSIAAGEAFRFSVTRNTGVGDTAAGDAHLLGMTHDET